MAVLTAVIQGPRRLGLREIELPAPAEGWVEVEVLACGICGSNLHAWRDPARGIEPGDAHPGAGGHEIAVRDPQSDGVAAVEPNLAGACGRCEACTRGAAWFCRDRATPPAWGFAGRIQVRAAALFPVRGASAEAATLVEPLACAIHALRGVHRPVTGRRVLVLGAGVTGLLAAAVARWLGAAEVVITARHAHQAAAAAVLGATVAGADERLRGFDVVVEAVGGDAGTLGQALAAVAPEGDLVVLGLFDAPQPLDARRAVWKEARIYFPVTYAGDDFQVAARLVERRTIDVAPLVTHRFRLTDVGAAFAAAADKSSGALRVVVTP